MEKCVFAVLVFTAGVALATAVGSGLQPLQPVQGVCMEQIPQTREVVDVYTTYSLRQETSDYVCGWFWKKCTAVTYRAVAEVQQRTRVVVDYTLEEACCVGYSGVPPNCTAICKPECQNGGECILPGVCNCPPGWTGAHCDEAICTLECQNGGQCVAPDTCVCLPNWTGPQCETVNIPAIAGLERIGATSFIVRLEPEDVEQSIGLVNAYAVVYQEKLNDSCPPDCYNADAVVLDDLIGSEIVITGLDPEKTYCAAVAAKTMVTDSAFSQPIPVPLYLNTPIEIQFTSAPGSPSCDVLMQSSTLLDQLEDRTAAGISEVGSFNFPTEHVINGELECETANMIFRATLLGTDFINSTEAAALLNFWASQAPVIVTTDANFTVDAVRCIDDFRVGTNTMTCINTEFEDIEADSGNNVALSVGGVVLIVAAVLILAVAITICCCCLCHRSRSKDPY